jgi:cell wall-associated NlpC family hydrolase
MQGSLEKGHKTVISLPVSNVVSEPGAQTLETQCVMGEEVLVLESRDGWTKIVALEQPSSKDERGYPGWVYTQNISSLSNLKMVNPVMVTEDIVRVYADEECSKIRCTILLGSEVDLINQNENVIKIKMPDGTEGYIEKDAILPLEHSAEAVVEHMHHFLDLGYLWGGTTPYGFDCSGLVYRVGKVHGYDLPRDSKDQALCGIEVDELKKGDLIFIGSDNRITHVAVYAGNNEIIHAAGSSGGSRVVISALKDYSISVIVCKRVF